MNDKPMILQLQTFPAISVGMSNGGLTQFRKELIKVGKYVKSAAKQSFEVTLDNLKHWVSEFDRWTAAGNKVPIPLGHGRENEPEFNQGWVTSMVVEGNSLFGILELSDPSLALTTDVSINVPLGEYNHNGVKYNSPITHVALTTAPVISGLKNFQVLSLSKGETSMEFLKKIAEKLGYKGEATEDLVLSALENKIKPEPIKKVELSTGANADTNAAYVVKMLSENRALKLSNLLKAGLITPAVKDVITAKYVEAEALTLSMSSKADDGFDMLYDVLVQNHPVKLDEVTGVQSLELSKEGSAKPNAMQKEVAKRRKDAGLDA